jgi:hypothetical protein
MDDGGGFWFRIHKLSHKLHIPFGWLCDKAERTR